MDKHKCDICGKETDSAVLRIESKAMIGDFNEKGEVTFCDFSCFAQAIYNHGLSKWLDKKGEEQGIKRFFERWFICLKGNLKGKTSNG